MAELAQNVLDHGGGRGRVVMVGTWGQLSIRVMDQGDGSPRGVPRYFPELSLAHAPEPRGLGQGCAAVGRLMDHVHAQRREGGGLIVAAQKRLRGPFP